MKNVALITGASSGIGTELASIHAQKGGDLVIIARREESLIKIKNELEAKHAVQVLVMPKDLTQLEAAQEVYDAVKKAGIEVEYLINNAGFGGCGIFHERPWEQDLAMIQLNIIALTALTRFFIGDFVTRNRGRILNVSSTASLSPGPLQAVYFATKAYVTFFSNAIAEELHNTNVTVTTLLPGPTETEFGRISGMDKTVLFSRVSSARSVAQDGYNAMLAGKLNVFGGLSLAQQMTMALIPFVPRKLMLPVMRRMQEVRE
jgi:short-subunit dehydrogenase